ncbi:hypothetical protein [Arthrobacter sp. Marseille-P9274]|uniref:hypothetical protein n=1 Tax=Arthrobacter sp. Marseille-P9274 TaxID=2866572 RepID=UPI0021CA67F1|nr:hypothetical protein [Arthrobacter sp. Marseille-P9274]
MKAMNRTGIRKAPLVRRLIFRAVMTVLGGFVATAFIVSRLGVTDPVVENVVLGVVVAAGLALLLWLTYRAGIRNKKELGASARDFSGGGILLLGAFRSDSGSGGYPGWSGGDSGGGCDGGGGGSE